MAIVAGQFGVAKDQIAGFVESVDRVNIVMGSEFGGNAEAVATEMSKIRNVFTDIKTDNIGADITYADSAADGSSFTVKSSGIYEISYTDRFNVAGAAGISKNAASLTTNLTSLTASERLAYSDSATANYAINVSWMGYLVAGDIIRPHTDGTAAGTLQGLCQFTISKVGKPNVTGVDVTPFVNLQFDTGSIGEIKAFAGNVDSAHFLTADGSAVSRSGYAELFRKIGTTYGAGDGSTTFNLPDLRGVFLRGLDAGRGLDSGRALGSYQADTFASHVHGIVVGNNAGADTRGFKASNMSVQAGTVVGTPNSEATGGTETRPKNVAINYGIRFKATNEAILTPTETFSTDTASLSYAGSAAYTLSTLQNAPVGTFITFTYAINTNTRTQTTTRPTQTDADMNVNGIQMFARAYNAASTAAQPAAIAIQI
jgi:microcystin-dependent protein